MVVGKGNCELDADQHAATYTTLAFLAAVCCVASACTNLDDRLPRWCISTPGPPALVFGDTPGSSHSSNSSATMGSVTEIPQSVTNGGSKHELVHRKRVGRVPAMRLDVAPPHPRVPTSAKITDSASSNQRLLKKGAPSDPGA